MSWRLGGWNARRLRIEIKGFTSSFPASQPSIFGHTTHFQKPHNAGSRRKARFFNTLMKK
jgi:hypothetical protein